MRTVRLTHANWVNDWLAGDAGMPLTLTDDQAYEAVEVHHLAVYTDDGPQAAPVAPALQYAEPVVTIEPKREFVPEEPERQHQLPELDSELAQPELKMPWSNASKAAWIDWAVHHGADPAVAAGLTKNELMNRYGERL